MRDFEGGAAGNSEGLGEGLASPKRGARQNQNASCGLIQSFPIAHPSNWHFSAGAPGSSVSVPSNLELLQLQRPRMGDGVRTHHIAALPFMINASSHCRKTSWCLVELPSPLEGIVERQGWAGPLQNVAALIQALAGITRVSPGGPMPVGRADHRTGSCAFPLACPGPQSPRPRDPHTWTPRGTSTNRSGRRMESSIPWLHAPTVLTTCSRLV